MMFYKETEYRDTEIGRIPKEWEVAQLGSENVSILIKSGSTPLKKVKEYWNGNIPFVTQSDMTKVDRYLHETSEKITDLGLKNSNLLLIPEDSVLLSMYGTIGKVVINKTPVAISQNIAAIILNKKNVNHEYLFYVVQKYSFQLKRRAKIITLKHLDIQIIKNMLLPFPSLQEQQKIAEILSTVDEAIQKTNDIIAKTERLKKGLMQELLTKGIGHKEFKDTEIGRIPKEWEVVKLKDVTMSIKDGTHNPPKRVPYGIPLLSARNIIDGKIVRLPDDTYITPQDYDSLSKRHEINKGDVLLTIVGTIGRSAVVRSDPDFAVQRSVAIIRPNYKLVASDFLHVVFLSPSFQKQLFSRIKLTTQSGVYLRELSKILLPLPSLHEQQKIAEIFSILDKKLGILKQEKVKLERIKQWFMEELLTGRIRVRIA